jgi:hypothetical protein
VTLRSMSASIADCDMPASALGGFVRAIFDGRAIEEAESGLGRLGDLIDGFIVRDVLVFARGAGLEGLSAKTAKDFAGFATPFPTSFRWLLCDRILGRNGCRFIADPRIDVALVPSSLDLPGTSRKKGWFSISFVSIFFVRLAKLSELMVSKW